MYRSVQFYGVIGFVICVIVAAYYVRREEANLDDVSAFVREPIRNVETDRQRFAKLNRRAGYGTLVFPTAEERKAAIANMQKK